MGAPASQVPALDRAFSIIELLSVHPEGMGISELAAALKIPKNNVFRITQTLLARAYLTRDEKSLSFSLSGKFLELGFRSRGDGDLMANAIDIMKELRTKTKETVLLGALLGDHGIVLHQVAGSHPFRFWVEPGTSLPLHAAAPCKAILAFLPVAERKRLLERAVYTRFNRRTLASRAAVEAALPEIATRGWALDDAEEMEGVTCVAAPIFDAQGYPVGSLWITGPSERLAPGLLPALGETVRDHAQMVSKRLGHGYFEPDGAARPGAAP
jgi:IclR family acetate operon transcriptional repressor